MVRPNPASLRRHNKLTAEQLCPLKIAGEGKEHLIARHIQPQANGCWYWNGEAFKPGTMRVDGKHWRAHRLVYAMFNKLADIPAHLHVHHECRRPGCVNPEHLKLLTLEQHQAVHQGETAFNGRGAPRC